MDNPMKAVGEALNEAANKVMNLMLDMCNGDVVLSQAIAHEVYQRAQAAHRMRLIDVVNAKIAEEKNTKHNEGE